MAGILQQFGLGLKGVNRVSNPLEMQEGELRLAQNAAVSAKYGRGALLKRKGMSAISGVPGASSGSMWAIMSMPFTDSDP